MSLLFRCYFELYFSLLFSLDCPPPGLSVATIGHWRHRRWHHHVWPYAYTTTTTNVSKLAKVALKFTLGILAIFKPIGDLML